MELKITKKQHEFMEAQADEVLFGGAAGGGKSMAQVIDALVFAIEYPGSRQLLVRRTFPEIEKSLLRMALSIYPRSIFTYHSATHAGHFTNGSIIDFGHCHTDDDVYKYQSMEFDVVRADELTHFTEHMYLYLLSRVRGTNGYPKMMKCSTNPGGIGHSWVKKRFIDIGEPNKVHEIGDSKRLFLPARVYDNTFLMESDPKYVKRLENLPKNERKALLKGDWDIFDGQFFSEWDRDLHVVKPFKIPDEWDKYFAMDYGLDMLAGYWIAMDGAGNAYVYREIYKSNLIISEAAEAVCRAGDIPPVCFAPPDLWNRRQDTGKPAARIFAESGLNIVRVNNNRVQGWLDLKEWLRPKLNEFGELKPRLRIFENCTNLIRALPSLTHDKVNPNDVARTPHELTHAPDALRYFVSGCPGWGEVFEDEYDREVEAFLGFGM
ncbi:MAG: terminase family protein [Clostridia bacterium]|nr:terminase family protein [Clostridia bacterium]